MKNIKIILGSIREGRNSKKAADYLYNKLSKVPGVITEVLDLKDYSFPLMKASYRQQEDADPALKIFSDKLNEADSFIIVSPEYYAGYPGALKNALDYFHSEFKRKPIGICTVSTGKFGGINCFNQLRQVCFGLGAVPVSAGLLIPFVNRAFDENGNLSDENLLKSSSNFINELVWITDAVAMKKGTELAKAM